MEEFIPTRGTIGWEGWHTGRSHPAIGRVYSYNNISCTENPARDNIQHWTLNLGSWTRGEGNEHTLCVLVTTETCCGGSVWGGVEPSLISHGMMTLFKQSSGYQNELYNCTMYKQKWGQYHKLVSYYLDCLTIYKRNCSGTNIMQCYSSKAVKVFMITRPWFPMNMISIRLSLAILSYCLDVQFPTSDMGDNLWAIPIIEELRRLRLSSSIPTGRWCHTSQGHVLTRQTLYGPTWPNTVPPGNANHCMCVCAGQWPSLDIFHEHTH